MTINVKMIFVLQESLSRRIGCQLWECSVEQAVQFYIAYQELLLLTRAGR